jgi:hypothetical protein
VTRVQAYTAELESAVRAFNARLRVGGSPFRFHESCVPGWLPPREGQEIYEEYFLAVDGGAVRGGYALKHQPFLLRGEPAAVANVNLPLSEGSVNAAYGTVGVQILADAMKRQPLLYALGMGSRRNTIARVLEALGWSLWHVPFYFRVLRPARFLRELSFLRGTAVGRALLDVLAWSGAGELLRALHFARARALRAAAHLEGDVVDVFGPWADDVWNEAAGRHSFVAVRDSASLNRLYPASDRRAIRYRVRHRGELSGWAVALDTPMSGHKHFGALRVGSVIDCLARPGREAAVAQAATRMLEARGVDLVVSNQADRTWGAALGCAGYLRGPSNFIFAASRALARRLKPFDVHAPRMHVNRSDGEGPTHL